MMNRRQMLAAGVAAAALPGMARAEEAESAKLNGLFDELFQAYLKRNPESATNLGLDTGANAALRSQLHSDSPESILFRRAETALELTKLDAIDRAKLSETEKVNLDTVIYTRQAAKRLEFDTGTGGPDPYVISQQHGAYQSVPDFLDTKHPINTAEDCEAYVARLKDFAVLMSEQVEVQDRANVLGVVAPQFILDKALIQMKALVKSDPAQSNLVASLARRAAAKGLSPRYAEDAAKIYQTDIRDALTYMISHTEVLRADAPKTAGVGALPLGEEFYAAALAYHTTTSMTAEEVHQLGLEQAADLTAKLDVLLKAQGLTQGTVGQRVAGLYKDPASFFPNTDAGKIELIGFCNERQAAIRPRLERFFKRQPPYQFEVRRVPQNIEAGASSAYSQGPSLDGSRPGIVYINLADTAEWPRWSLSSVTYHEGLPGHQLEAGLALSNTVLPMIRKVSGFAAYSEGWGLYAEQLADELGMYEADPLSRIGYLRFALFRALRCVTDTGIHAMGWSREQAIKTFVDGEGDAPGFAAREVERYCVQPGQACSYKIGHTVWNALRTKAQTALGARYDIRDFHEAGLACGRVPLDVLSGVVDRWLAVAKAV
ncbi:MAG: DUF885 family protein [Caulobacteraceae bacterium]